MRKILYFILLVSSLLFVTACTSDGTLRIVNKTGQWTTVRIDGVDFDLSPSETLIRNWSLSNSIFGVEEKNVRCRIHERLFLFEEEFIATVKAGSTTTKIIVNDAGGLEIVNVSSSYIITKVYISSSSSLIWGNDMLSGYIRPQESVQWNLSPGLWDIKLVDNYGDEFFAFDERFTVGVLRSYDYTGFMRIDNGDEIKANKAIDDSFAETRVKLLD